MTVKRTYIFTNAFKLDKVGNGWFARITFLILVLMQFFFNIYTPGDSDFAPLMTFVNDMMEDPQAFLLANPTPELPISEGNIVFLVSGLLLSCFVIFCVFLFCGMNLRIGRKLLNEKVASIPLIIFRSIVLTIISSFLLGLVLSLSYFLMIIAVFVLPVLMVIPGHYLSGEAGLFASIKNGINNSKGSYFTLSTNLLLILLTDMGLEIVYYLASILGLDTAALIFISAICNTYFYLLIGMMMMYLYLHVSSPKIQAEIKRQRQIEDMLVKMEMDRYYKSLQNTTKQGFLNKAEEEKPREEDKSNEKHDDSDDCESTMDDEE